MIWYRRYPEDGEIRTVQKFASVPIEIKGVVRWLEFVNIKQEYRKRKGIVGHSQWVNVKFLKYIPKL